jgi:hypothetical protein
LRNATAEDRPADRHSVTQIAPRATAAPITASAVAAPRRPDCVGAQSILHDRDDQRAEAILANCRKAMNPGGRLAIIEQVLPDPGAVDGQRDPTFEDLEMLVLYGGKEPAHTEFEELCQRAGLEIKMRGGNDDATQGKPDRSRRGLAGCRTARIKAPWKERLSSAHAQGWRAPLPDCPLLR